VKPGGDPPETPSATSPLTTPLTHSAPRGGAAQGSVLVTRRIPEAGLELLREGGAEVLFGCDDGHAVPTDSELLDRIVLADVLLPLLTERVDRTLLERAAGIRGVANYAVGFDNIDLAAATHLGIPVSNTPGILTDTTADLTWALLLAIARRVPESDRHIREGGFRTWEPSLFLGSDVSPGGSGQRKVLGIVGLGRIGEAVARRASGFDMDVIASESASPSRAAEARPDTVPRVPLDALLRTSDFISLHLPLTRDTRHLIDEAALRRMKPTAYLVNTARGPLVDEVALVRALQEGWIAGAALDVYENEPTLAPGLADLDNVVLAPHIGSASRDTRDRMAIVAATNALHHLRGDRAPNVLNPEVYESEAWKRRVAQGGSLA